MVLLIDNYDSFSYNLYQLIAQLTQNVVVIRNDQITVPEIQKKTPAAIILSPGPGRPENAGVCIEIIKNLAATTPILGVCLGHQAIALAFGGKVVPAKNVVHGKSDYIFHAKQEIYQHLPIPFIAGRYHSLVVDRDSLPSSLLVTAESPDGVIMGIKHKVFPSYGMQFHPESIITAQGQELVKQFLLEAKVC